MKMLLKKTWRDIWTRKGQFGAIVVLVALGIASYVIFVGAALDLGAAAETSNEDLALADFSAQVQSAPASVVGEIESIDGVAAVQGRLVVDTGMDMGDDEVAARVIGLPANAHPVVNDVLPIDGEYLSPDDPRGVLLSNSFASERDIAVGDTLSVRAGGATTELTVRGIVVSIEYLFPRRTKAELPNAAEFAVVFAAQDEVEALFGQPGTVNEFGILVEDGADRQQVIADVEEVLSPYYVLTTVKQEDQPSNFGVNEEITQNRTMAGLIPMLVLAISTSSLAIALSRLVQSQRGEIGLSKALGYTDGQILLQYLAFSLFIALLGSVLGIGLGFWGQWGVGQTYQTFLNLPLLESVLRFEAVGGAVALSTLACIVAGIAPAIRSARMLPARAMHQDPNLSQTKGSIPVIERLLGWAMPKSLAFRMPLRNVFRNRRRALYTVIGTVFSLILIISMWAMNDAFGFFLGDQFKSVELWDATVAFGQFEPTSRADEIASLDGVTRVDSVVVVPLTIVVGDTEREITLTGMEPDAGFHGFKVAEGADAPDTLRAGDIVLPETLAKVLDVGAGDAVLLESPFIDAPVSATVGSVSEEMLGIPVFASTEFASRLAGTSVPVMNAAYVFYDGDQGTLERSLYSLPGVANVQVKQVVVDMLETMLGLALFFMAIMFAFAFLVAFVVLYNTITTNVIERTREIATMQTIGEDRTHLAWMVTSENLLLAVVSVPIGVWLGLQAAGVMFEAISTEVYTLPAYINPNSYVWIVLSILGILLLAEVPPIRRIFRLDLAEATKVME